MSRKTRQMKKKTLPPELSVSGVVAELTCQSTARGGVCNVYLIGTIHLSRKSCEEVRALIRHLKPEAVFLELCASRAHYLDKEFKTVGTEFAVANEEAMKYGAKVILGDRLIGITLRRLPVMACVKELLTCYFLEPRENISNFLKKLRGNGDASIMNHFIGEADRMFPSFQKTMLHERNQYMMAKLLEVASKHNSVVAVVGKGHVQGIQEHWKQHIDMKQLLRIPIGKSMFTTVGGIGATIALISGIYLLKDVVLSDIFI